jgi:hypothetical protein
MFLCQGVLIAHSSSDTILLSCNGLFLFRRSDLTSGQLLLNILVSIESLAYCMRGGGFPAGYLLLFFGKVALASGVLAPEVTFIGLKFISSL